MVLEYLSLTGAQNGLYDMAHSDEFSRQKVCWVIEGNFV